MADNMTDKQFEKILKMVEMILDGCKDLDEAKAKVKELTEDQKKEKSAEQPTGYKQRGGGLATKAPNCLYRYNIKKTWQGQYNSIRRKSRWEKANLRYGTQTKRQRVYFVRRAEVGLMTTQDSRKSAQSASKNYLGGQMGENTRQNCTRQNKKKNPGRQQPCWGSSFCTNLTQPTGNLDSKSSREIMEILRKLHTEGRTVILITHDDKIAQSAKRIIRIMDGKIESDSGMADKKSMEEENGEE